MRKFLILVLALMPLCMSAQEKSKAYMVSNAHFDTQWNWDVVRSITDYVPKTMDGNLFLLERYPNYIFNFEGGIKYSWMKEYYPEKYDLVKKYIAEGRWHVTGSTWDANDTNIPSPESFARNILYGQHFYRDEFGVEGTDIFLPDCFGFSWTLPSIAAHADLIGFSTQKLKWRKNPFYGDEKIPFEIGLWEGIDGSKIMLVADGHAYVTKLNYEDLSNSEEFQKMAANNVNNTLYHYYGVGDTGGAPTIESVRAVELSLKGEGPVEIISAESDRLYKDYLPFEAHPELPVWKGELLMDVHGTGCYTSQAAMKLYNRRNELLADAAERSAVAADWLGNYVYPKEFLTDSWKRFIWHQFHDDLTGTSLPSAYEFSWNDELISMKHFADVLETSVGAVALSLDTKVSGIPVVIYNQAGFPVSEIVEISLPEKLAKAAVYNEKGKAVPSQIVPSENGTKILVKAEVPATGYVVYDIRKGGSRARTTMTASSEGMENSVYKLSFDENGDISSIVDKRNGRELVKEGKAIRLALFTENNSAQWPAWEISKKTLDAEPVSISGDVKISVVENGSLRSAVCIERTYGESSFRQYVVLNEGPQSDRIDICNEVDWHTENAVLKAEFPLTVSNGNAVYDLGLGSIERGNNTDISYEVPAQQWVDLAEKDGSYGVSFMSDSKYGWDKPDDNTVRLTLFHAPETPKRYLYQKQQDMGYHKFTYSIVGHDGDYRKAETVRKAEIFNQPLLAFTTSKHKGSLGRSFSFAESLNGNVALRAMKQAEDNDAYVVRFYETSGLAAQDAVVKFAAEIEEAKELNGNEDIKGEASFNGNELSFNVGPFGIRTYLVKLKKPSSVPTVQTSAPAELPYNMRASSYNAFRNEGKFDEEGHSYAAELIPEELTYKGIRFELKDGTVMNAVECKNDTIVLPEGGYNKLYLLAAAKAEDTECTFMVDGTAQKAVVPYYGGFIGQWGHTGHTEGFLKDADIAHVGTHKHSSKGNKDLPYDYTYMFRIGLDIPAGAKTLVLPDNSNVVIFAATAADDRTTETAPACDLLKANIK